MVRVARGTRLAEVTTDAIDEAGLVDALHRAAALAVHAPEDPGFPGFAGDDGQAGDARPFPSRFAARTAAIDAGERTSIVARVLDAIAAAGLVGAGGLETRAETTCVATSAGAARAHRASFSTFRVWASETAGAGGASGFGHAMHREMWTCSRSTSRRRTPSGSRRWEGIRLRGPRARTTWCSSPQASPSCWSGSR